MGKCIRKSQNSTWFYPHSRQFDTGLKKRSNIGEGRLGFKTIDIGGHRFCSKKLIINNNCVLSRGKKS